jgi:phosphatidylserine/phosphatidylglycerophosphate/cardiolipin synthase-like enzyme
VTVARTIFKGRGAQARELEGLLQTIFACEMLSPSEHFWLVSPWVSDIAVLDNRTGSFSGLEPDWGRRGILVTEVLQALLRTGTRVTLATRALDHNERFRTRLETAARDVVASDLVSIVWDEEGLLHEKGLLGDEYCLSGSMNLTESGVRLNDEQVRFSLRPEEVAATSLHFHQRYGGQ